MNAELDKISKEMIKLQLVHGLGSMLLGFGTYGAFLTNGNAFIPALNNPEISYSVLLVGGVLMTWKMKHYIGLMRHRSDIIHNKRT